MGNEPPTWSSLAQPWRGHSLGRGCRWGLLHRSSWGLLCLQQSCNKPCHCQSCTSEPGFPALLRASWGSGNDMLQFPCPFWGHAVPSCNFCCPSATRGCRTAYKDVSPLLEGHSLIIQLVPSWQWQRQWGKQWLWTEVQVGPLWGGGVQVVMEAQSI